MFLPRILLAALMVVTLAACGADQPATSSAAASDHATTAPMDDMDHADDHGGSEGGEFAFGRPANAADADRTIEIRTDNELVFDPAEVTVAAGETVTFSITNEGDLLHDFVIGDEAAQQEHAEAMAAMDEAMGSEGEEHGGANAVSAPPGETVDLTWTFHGETEGLLYGCHEPGHYAAGMVGTIVVES